MNQAQTALLAQVVTHVREARKLLMQSEFDNCGEVEPTWDALRTALSELRELQKVEVTA